MPKLSKHLADWLGALVTSRAPRTIESYTYLIDQINPILGDKALSKLKPKHVQRLLAGIAATGHTRTAEQVYTLLHTALKGTPAAATMAQVSRPLHHPAPHSWWSVEDLRAYLAATSGAGRRLAWLLALCCGLRRGEICGLRWCDIDLSAQVIHIRNQRVYVVGKGVIDTPPKTGSSIRTIPLPPQLAAILADAYLLAQADQLIGNPSPYVLRGKCRGGLAPNTLTEWHVDQLAACGVRPIRLHDMRHTMATLALTLGVDIHVIQSLLGHASVVTTAQVYAHVVTKVQRNAVATVTHTVLS